MALPDFGIGMKTDLFQSYGHCRVSAEKSADKLMGIPSDVICYFSLDLLNIFSLLLIFQFA